MLSPNSASGETACGLERARRCRATPRLRVIVLMGVSGAGKSTLGEALATQLSWQYRDADSFHPQRNIAKMSKGLALTDDDRWPWLQKIADWIDEVRARDDRAIVSCSALKRIYRDRLLAGRSDVRLVYLKGEKSLIRSRMSNRECHFMPTALLDSQFEALEEPGIDEWPVVASIHSSPRRIAESILAELAHTGIDPI